MSYKYLIFILNQIHYGQNDPNYNYPAYMAWRNITSSSGADISNDANYFCIGPETACWWVKKRKKCVCAGGKWSIKKVARPQDVISATLSVGSHKIIFVKDSLGFWCDLESYNLGTTGCDEKNEKK